MFDHFMNGLNIAFADETILPKATFPAWSHV